MALTSERISNIRIAGTLLLTAFAIGLGATVLAGFWQKESMPATLPEFFDSLTYSSSAYLLPLLAGNVIAALAAVGIAVSAKPAGLLRALIYGALGTAAEASLLILTTPWGTEDAAPAFQVFVFHLLVALSLIFTIVRRPALTSRLVARRSALVGITWMVVLGTLATLTFPFTQRGYATSATEAPDVHQLRQISARLLAATDVELSASRATTLTAISENQASILGFNNFDCGINTAPTFFEADFGKATLKVAPPELVVKEEFELKPGEIASGPRTSAGSIYTDASVAEAKAYWRSAADRVRQRVGVLPTGWKAQYDVGQSGILATLRNDSTRAYVLFTLRDGDGAQTSPFFSAHADGCHPLSKAPSGTR